MLIGKQDQTSLWNVSFLPSKRSPRVIVLGKQDNPTVITPTGPTQWSANFGDHLIQEFAVQVSSTSDMKGTRAHWYTCFKISSNCSKHFRFVTSRLLKNPIVCARGLDASCEWPHVQNKVRAEERTCV